MVKKGMASGGGDRGEIAGHRDCSTAIALEKGVDDRVVGSGGRSQQGHHGNTSRRACPWSLRWRLEACCWSPSVVVMGGSVGRQSTPSTVVAMAETEARGAGWQAGACPGTLPARSLPSARQNLAPPMSPSRPSPPPPLLYHCWACGRTPPRLPRPCPAPLTLSKIGLGREALLWFTSISSIRHPCFDLVTLVIGPILSASIFGPVH
jgi:hypothetical protein